MRFSIYPSAVAGVILLPVALGTCFAGRLHAAPPLVHPAKSNHINSLPNPQSYQTGTPERTIAEFVAAWHDKDFTRVARFTQLSWKHAGRTASDPVKELRKEFTPIPVVGAQIGGTAHDQNLPAVSENAKNISVTIVYRSDTGLHTKTVAVTVYRELRPFYQTVKGTWGVNPFFTLFLDD